MLLEALKSPIVSLAEKEKIIDAAGRNQKTKLLQCIMILIRFRIDMTSMKILATTVCKKPDTKRKNRTETLEKN